MKIYLRILQYAPGASTRFFKFLIFSILGAVFNGVYLALVSPLLNLLFKQKIEKTIHVLPPFSFSESYFTSSFNYYFYHYLETAGPVKTLLFVCVLILVFVLLSNTFRYLERMVASRVKVDVVKNLRTGLFRNVSQLHIGYFNDQRRGDLISRFTNDVSEVENTVVNGFKEIKEPITMIIFIIMLLMISVKLTLITMVVLPITGGIIAAIVKQLKKKAIQSQETMGRIVNILDEAFGGMRVISSFNARHFILDKIESETSYHRKVNLSMSRRNELASPVSESLGV